MAYPKIAQSQVKNAELEVTAQILTDPAPNSAHVVLTSIVKNPSIFHPTLDAFNASLYLPDAGPQKPFMMVEVPSIKAEKVAGVKIDDHAAMIVDMDQFVEYNKRTLQRRVYDVGMSGTTALHLGSFPVTHVNFTKTVSMNGKASRRLVVTAPHLI